MSHLRVTLVQTDLAWQDPAANRHALAEKLRPLAGSTDLIVLPEMFSTGFTMQPETQAEVAGGPTIEWLQELAAALKVTITGSVSTRDGNRCYNRLTWMRPDGTSDTYDKRHLFRMGREHEHYAGGEGRLIVELNGWRICPLVCYDLRFPVWSRNRSGTDYDLLIYVANWPARRRYAWQTLLKARAIENLSYCIGVNRVGADGQGIEHSGDSAALDYLGQPLMPESEQAFVQTVTLDRAGLDEHRRRFPAHLDADAFELK
ncbi:MAG TPA: amidohydrolase [Steroidobacteraceae bacterium]|nr:amidohydrolase [Steroidobacteraceae bacterium]